MKPFLVFGLRGTLVERIHSRNVPPGMPAPDLTVGLAKVWLRPHMMETLLALQPHCDLAIWSSTTTRNTTPLVEAVFNSPRHFPQAAVAGTKKEEAQSSNAASDAGVDKEGAARFRKRGSGFATSSPTSSSAGGFVSPLTFKFVWTREHTDADGFRRRNAVVHDDSHATVKDLTKVFQQFPGIATPSNTVLIDDTPSKGKMHADNFLWLESCEALEIKDATRMQALREFIEKEIIPAKDVREVLPRRIR